MQIDHRAEAAAQAMIRSYPQSARQQADRRLRQLEADHRPLPELIAWQRVIDQIQRKSCPT